MIEKRQMIFRSLMILALCLSWGFPVQSQTGTSQGKEFYLGFLINVSNENLNENTVHISTTRVTEGIIEIPGSNYRVPFEIPANTSREFKIPDNLKPSLVNQKESVAIRITSNEEISVHAYNQILTSSDASMILPVQSLSENYIVHAFNNDDFREGFTANQILIVATEDNTEIEVNPTADLINEKDEVVQPKGEVFRITLDVGEQVAYHALGNLSATTVSVINDDEDNFCQPIAVFIGHINSLVDACESADHLFSQMYPTSDWGTDYAVLPFATRFGGDIVQVFAAENETVVNFGSRQERLNRGERFSFVADEPTFLSANKKISVMQLSRGRECDAADRGDTNADPFLLFLSPVNQVIQNINFNVMPNEVDHHYFLSLLAPTNDLQVFVEGDDISNLFLPLPGNTDWSYATVPINQGPRSLRSSRGVVGHLYGFGTSMSFGMALGANLGNFEIAVTDEQFGTVTDLRVCESSLLTFNATSEIPFLKEAYTDFRWLIGEDTVLMGEEVTYQFNNAGVFDVQLIASKSGDQCSQLRKDIKLKVIEDGIDDIIGPQSVCPNAQNITYSVENPAPNYNYEWTVNGGAFTALGTAIRVDWAPSIDAAEVMVKVTSPEGCIQEVIMPVRLNESLTPNTPKGPSQICSDDLTNHRYTTPFASGSSYQWVAEGGEVVSGQGTHEVLLNWNGPGCHRLFFTESTTVNALCDGQSGVLEVEVLAAIDLAPTITPIDCFGDSNGALNVDITGGLPPYTLLWEDGTSGSTLENVAAGNYQVMVTDALGCQFNQLLTVTSPNQLTADVSVQNAVCNGARGAANIMVNGGTAPFRFSWSDDLETQLNNRSDLTKGMYEVIITDRNGCAFSLNFEITEPAPLMATLEEESACPLQRDGSLSVAVSGGTTPYTFVWEIAPSSNSAQLVGLASGNYNLEIVDAAGCSLQLSGEVMNIRPLIKMPNVFTPNDDGINDEFGPVFNCVVDFEMFVYNNWGEVIFYTQDIRQGWDGYLKGALVPQGNYLYQAKYQTIFNGTRLNEQLSGKVQVIY